MLNNTKDLLNYIINTELDDFINYIEELGISEEFSGISEEAWIEDAVNDARVDHIYKTAMLSKFEIERID